MQDSFGILHVNGTKGAIHTRNHVIRCHTAAFAAVCMQVACCNLHEKVENRLFAPESMFTRKDCQFENSWQACLIRFAQKATPMASRTKLGRRRHLDIKAGKRPDVPLKGNMKLRTRFIVQAALIAAVYASLTLLLQPISYGIIQFRVSEALTILPALMPAAIPGLFVGCLLSNTLGGMGWQDIVFGSLTTLAAAALTWRFRRWTWFAPFPPVVLNGAIVGTYLWFLFGKAGNISLPIICLSVAAGEAAVCILLGLPLLWFIRRSRPLQHAIGLETTPQKIGSQP